MKAVPIGIYLSILELVVDVLISDFPHFQDAADARRNQAPPGGRVLGHVSQFLLE